ncbi:MAG: cyclic nucleotide-binding domain-containing protein [Elusimicrobia bacterium]|nr:cyclic nucleotide-binding domain-containing protein [Elusimicrobiota bacterium]
MQKAKLGSKEFQDLLSLSKNMKFFVGFKIEQLEILMPQLQIFAYEPGEYVCKQGDQGDAFYIIYDGRVSIYVKPGFFSKTRKVTELAPGEVFGEMALLDQSRRTASVQADTPLKLFVLEQGYFEAVYKWNPLFYDKIRDLADRRRKENSAALI